MHNNGSDPTILSICRKNFWHSACWSIWNFFLLENVRREKCVVETKVYLFTQWLSSSVKLTTLTFDQANKCISHIDTIKWISTTCNSTFHWLQKVIIMVMNNTGWASAQRNSVCNPSPAQDITPSSFRNYFGVDIFTKWLGEGGKTPNITFQTNLFSLQERFLRIISCKSQALNCHPSYSFANGTSNNNLNLFNRLSLGNKGIQWRLK